MKQTLLEMVQRILEALDLQVVESIKDTREAQQIARIIKETYYHLLHVRDIKTKSNLIQLHSISDLDHPTYLKFNDDVTNIDIFKYYQKDTEKYCDIYWLSPEDFIDHALQLNPHKPNVTQVVDFSGIKFNVYNDRHPQYYTSFDDEYVVLDAWKKDAEDTIEEENTVVYGVKLPEFKLEDDFVPDLAPQHFGYLFSESKVQAGNELLKEVDNIELDRARKHLISANMHSRRQIGLESRLWGNRQLSGRGSKYGPTEKYLW